MDLGFDLKLEIGNLTLTIMNKYFLKFSVIFVAFLSVVGFFTPAIFGKENEVLSATQCICMDDVNKIDTEHYDAKFVESIKNSGCVEKTGDCREQIKKADPSHNYSGDCPAPENLTACKEIQNRWEQQKAARATSAGASVEGSSGSIAGNIPNCLLRDELSPECRDVGIFIQLFINWGSGSFAILGIFALSYFIYGGFILILSQGNPEKIKKGTDSMMAAVIGLFICFVAYLAIQFLGDAVGLKSEYRLL